MTEVVGQFDVTLRTPIGMYPGLDPKTMRLIEIVMSDAKISVIPLAITDPVVENGQYVAGPNLTELRVWIQAAATIKTNAHGENELARFEEHRFEGILIEATNRILVPLKRITGQWDLDTRRPIHSYSYKYYSADESVTTQFPLNPRNKVMPQYILATLRFPDMKEVTAEIWAATALASQQPTVIPTFEQFEYDAKNSLKEVRFEEALLFSAFAVEQILYLTCEHLLKSQGDLTLAQRNKFLKRPTVSQLLKKITSLTPGTILHQKEVETLIDDRNDIAHHKRTSVSDTKAAEATDVVATLKKELAPFLI